MVPRLTSYFSFAASSALSGTLRLRHPDFLLVESPPLFLGPTGVYLAKTKRSRLIFNVSDLWPESAVQLGVVARDSTGHRAAAALERWCYRNAWLVSGQSQAILHGVQRAVPGTRTFHLSNGCDTTRFGAKFATPDARRRLDPEGDRFVVLYAGLHGLAQGLGQLLDAAEDLRAQASVRFTLIGDGPEKRALVSDAERRGLRNVRFLEPVDAGEVPALLASADALVVPLKQDIPGAVPSKIYEAMASEKPLILVGSGEAADIVNGAGGIVVSPGDRSGLARAIVGLASSLDRGTDLGSKLRIAAVNRYDRTNISDRFISELERNLR
jgi:glycosyltransferase involved in cell wall biosynthesis